MKVLILSCNNGGGHNAASRALKECFIKSGAQVDIRDSVSYVSPKFSRALSKAHIFAYRNFPGIIDKLVKKDSSGNDDKKAVNSVYKACALGAEKLYNEMLEGKYDSVVSTHIFGSFMTTAVKRKFGYSIPSYFIATDYNVSYGSEGAEVDGIFVGHPDLIEGFAGIGYDRSIVYPTGIPARNDFDTSLDKAEAKRRLGISENKKVVLLMGGSMGAGPIGQIAYRLANISSSDCLFICLCGNNRKLKKAVEKYEKDNILAVGFTDKMSLYMDAAEFMVTKPGGLTSTELGLKRLPAVFIDAIASYETENMVFFESKGYGYGASTADEAVRLAKKLLEEESLIAEMRENLREFPVKAAQAVCDIVMGTDKNEADSE